MQQMNNHLDKCVVFILTHGRSGNVKTLLTLRSSGYNGRVVLILDNQDEQIDDYSRRYGADNCYVFDKQKYIDNNDKIIPVGNKCILFARNASFDIAEELGYEYFVELDDDYEQFMYRYDDNGNFTYLPMRRFDYVLNSMLDYYINTPSIGCLAMAQGGDFIGGSGNPMGKGISLKRKAMNFLLCSTKRRFEFKGAMNDDVNTYVRLGQQGLLFLTTNQVMLNQTASQSAKGGITDLYRSEGTYSKSFSSVIVAPSCARITLMGESSRRIHHKILWKYAVPKIIHQKYKKL